MNGFGWLSQVMGFFGQFVPQILHVKSNEGCVLFRRGKAKELKPGMHVYWPLWSETSRYPTCRQTLNPVAQVVETADGVAVVASVTVVYRVDDIMLALHETWSPIATITDISQRAARVAVEEETLADHREFTQQKNERLTETAKADLRKYGIAVQHAFFSDFARCFVLRNISCSYGTTYLETAESK